MVAGNSLGIGMGITLGVLILISIALLTIGVLTARRRQEDQLQEMERRRTFVLQQHQQEQQQWRERRLRQVVLVLVDRGEVEEGVPLAFQLPNHSEVLARRKLRNARFSQRARLEEMLEEQDPRLDEQSRAITRMTLDELLANGRPPDADPGPDILQLLLDGQEVRPEQSEEETENEDEFVDMTPQATPQPQDLTQSENLPSERRAPYDNSGSSRNGVSRQDSTESFTPPGNRDVRSLRREEAIIKELRARSSTTRRRKTAEELYGPGIAYIQNPNNSALDKSMETAARRDLSSSTHQPDQGSTFTRFLSPLTPWRVKNKRKDSSVSAFEDRVPPTSEIGNSVRQPLSPPGQHLRQVRSIPDETSAAGASPSPKNRGGQRHSLSSSEPF